MRLVYVALAALVLVSFQPTASAKGCSIDLTDPTSPRIYGDCVGTTGYVSSEDNEVTASRTTSFSLGIDDDTGCQDIKCAVTFTQTTEAGVVVHGTDAPPEVFFDLSFGVGTSSENRPGGQDCEPGLESHANVLVPCMRMHG